MCGKLSRELRDTPLSYSIRLEVCQKLEGIQPLGKDWKMFADKMGLTQDEIRVLENQRDPTLYAERVLRVLETQYPDRYTICKLKTALEDMGRLDLLELLSRNT